MDESSDFSVKQKLDIKNHTDELWNVINEELIVKFKDLHARLGSDTVNIGAIGDQISQTIYDTVSQHFGTINMRIDLFTNQKVKVIFYNRQK